MASLQEDIDQLEKLNTSAQSCLDGIRQASSYDSARRNYFDYLKNRGHALKILFARGQITEEDIKAEVRAFESMFKQLKAQGVFHDEGTVYYVFMANLRPTTPKKFLAHHGVTIPDLGNDDIHAPESFGAWHPKRRTFREVGIDMEEPQSTMSSIIGQIPLDGGHLLPYLITLRDIAENPALGLEVKKLSLVTTMESEEWSELTKYIGGSKKILGQIMASLTSV